MLQEAIILEITRIYWKEKKLWTTITSLEVLRLILDGRLQLSGIGVAFNAMISFAECLLDGYLCLHPELYYIHAYIHRDHALLCPDLLIKQTRLHNCTSSFYHHYDFNCSFFFGTCFLQCSYVEKLTTLSVQALNIHTYIFIYKYILTYRYAYKRYLQITLIHNIRRVYRAGLVPYRESIYCIAEMRFFVSALPDKELIRTVCP